MSSGVFPELGDGTLTGRFADLGQGVWAVEVSLTIGAGTKLGNGLYRFSLPTPTLGRQSDWYALAATVKDHPCGVDYTDERDTTGTFIVNDIEIDPVYLLRPGHELEPGDQLVIRAGFNTVEAQ